MKKLFFVVSLVLGISVAATAQNEGGLFHRGNTSDQTEENGFSRGAKFPGVPGHGEETDQPAPLGSGALLLIGFGAAYALSKKDKE